jgi:hypothetical protein
MLETLLTRVGLPVLVGVLADALRGVDTPVTKGAAAALDAVETAIQQGQISPEQIKEAHRHAEEMARMQTAQEADIINHVNTSLRAEIASSDPYVRRMRPTFGYLMALTWAAQMLALAYVIVFETDKAGVVLHATGSISAIWAVGLSVLGIYVYKRSEDKKLATPPAAPETIYWLPHTGEK